MLNKKLSIVIMAHPSRKHLVQSIIDKLGFDVPVVWDEISSVWDTAKRAWLAHDMTCEYGLTIQDDMLLCNDFVDRVKAVLEKDVVYNFYMGQRPRFKNKIARAKRNKEPFLILDNLHHECCWAIRTNRIPEMIAYADKLNPDTDRYLNRYIQEKKLKVYFTMPSLANHRSEKSLHDFNRGSYPSGAAYYIGDES